MPTDHRAILCFDFDGTFVNREPHAEAMGKLLGMLEDLRSRGSAWVINTGRSLHQTLEGLTQHGIRQTPDYIVAREGEVFQPGPFKRWIDVGQWNTQRHEDHKKLYKSSAKFLDEIRRWLQRNTEAAFISEASEPAGIISSTEEEMARICAWLDPLLQAHPELDYQRNSIYLRFTHHHYSKGTALLHLAKFLNITPEHTFAAGDNHNDLSMLALEVAHQLACPSNSLPIVKDAILAQRGFVASQPATQGCIEALSHYFYD